MEKLREILRLYEISKLSCREIAAVLNISKTVVSQYIGEFKEAKLSYLDIQGISDSALLERLGKKKRQSERYRILESYFKYFAVELKKTGVTLYLLWQEYIAKHPNGYGHSQFCYHFQYGEKLIRPPCILSTKPKDKCFADFAAEKLSIVDINTGEIRQVEVFIAILAASQKTYVEAVLSQESHNFIRANENAFLKFGGVTESNSA